MKLLLTLLVSSIPTDYLADIRLPRPLACIIWLLIAVVLLLIMKEDIDIYNPADLDMRYSIIGLMLLPYTVRFPEGEGESQAPQDPNQTEKVRERMASSYPETTSSSSGNSTRSYPLVARQDCESSAFSTTERSDTISVPRGSNYVTIRISMPSSFGWRSWRWYEAVIETMP